MSISIKKLQITAEIDGRLCLIRVPEEAHDLLLRMIQTLSDGEINAVRLPDTFKMIPIAQALTTGEPT